MFEFAISQQKPQAPSRRFLASLVTSLIGHFLIILLLIEYPQLLGRGLKTWLRHPIFSSASETKEPSWRTVAILGDKNGRMQMPSAETLRQFKYDWAAHKGTEAAPPIRIRWQGDTQSSGENKSVPVPKPVPGLQEPKPIPQIEGAAAVAERSAGTPAGTSTASGGAAGNESQGARAGAVYLPPPTLPVEPKQPPKKAVETAGMVSPTAIPKEIPSQLPPANLNKGSTSEPVKTQQPQVFENEQKAIRSEGTGFFDTRGFPLGDYATIIIERVKGNWFIPSNLRNSQGRTTVIFFIDKEGHLNNAHIVNASGSNSLDLAALNAIIGSNPFPPLPKGFPGERVGAKFVFAYNERQ